MAEEEFVTGILKIVSPDVIINEILFKMDVVDVINLCSSSRGFRKFCLQRSDKIWIMLLRRDYPEHGIRGDPKQHYIKIFSGRGSAYIVAYNSDLATYDPDFGFYFDIENKLRYAGKMDRSTKYIYMSELTEQINILGNPLEISTKMWVVFEWIPFNNKNDVFATLDDALNHVTNEIFDLVVENMAHLVEGVSVPLFDIDDPKEEDVQKEAEKYPTELTIQPFTKQNIYNYMKDNRVFNEPFPDNLSEDKIWWQLEDFIFAPPN